ncbi:MAG: hypothetical protein M3Y33_18315 [Actinomycetota bacterium]|nr:hypothetical protein [Actinomycetota bacterium]
MKQQLPPEDRPGGHGLVPASDEEVIAGAVADNPPGSPWWTGRDFVNALTHEDGPQLRVLRQLVTPESLPAWGDFGAARELLDNVGMMSRAEYPAPGVAYVRYVSNPAQGLKADAPVMMMARAVATLQFRPEIDGWQVHALGDYCLPEDLPRLQQ